MPDRKTILLVDDESALRVLFSQVLERSGFQVLEAASGQDAIALTNGSAQSIDVLVSDVMMPGMSGPQLARQICATHPEVKVVLISGFSESPTYLEQGWEFLQKPFPPNILCAKLHEICDNAG